MNADTNIPAARLAALEQRIAAAAKQCGRRAGDIKLLAVSKRKPAEAIAQLADCRHLAFGENYLQEALPKLEALAARRLEWHFIGRIQANKTRLIADKFDWVHTLDRVRIAERLSAQRPAGMTPLNVCIEVNVSAEASKAGVNTREIHQLAERVQELPGLQLRGLMTLPAPFQRPAEQRAALRPLVEAHAELNRQGFKLDTLSMGTSHDFEVAIAEGATVIRVGTALFGPCDV